MSVLIPDVSFPNHGRVSTAPVRDRLPLRLIELSGCTIDPRWCGQDMTSPTWRLYFDLDDGAEVWVRGRCTPLRAGHLYLIPAWLRWSARCRQPVRHFNAMVDLPSLPRERVMRVCREPLMLASADDPLAQAWLRAALVQAAATVADAAMVAEGHALVWSALARYVALLGRGAAELLPTDADSRFEVLRAWVEMHVDRQLPRAALARQAGVSEAELARRCARVLGTSPARWVRDLRVAHAAELLRLTDQPIEAVASACGLGDRSRFSKVFARIVGSPPAAFRRRHRT